MSNSPPGLSPIEEAIHVRVEAEAEAKQRRKESPTTTAELTDTHVDAGWEGLPMSRPHAAKVVVVPDERWPEVGVYYGAHHVTAPEIMNGSIEYAAAACAVGFNRPPTNDEILDMGRILAGGVLSPEVTTFIRNIPPGTDPNAAVIAALAVTPAPAYDKLVIGGSVRNRWLASVRDGFPCAAIALEAAAAAFRVHRGLEPISTPAPVSGLGARMAHKFGVIDDSTPPDERAAIIEFANRSLIANIAHGVPASHMGAMLVDSCDNPANITAIGAAVALHGRRHGRAATDVIGQLGNEFLHVFGSKVPTPADFRAHLERCLYPEHGEEKVLRVGHGHRVYQRVEDQRIQLFASYADLIDNPIYKMASMSRTLVPEIVMEHDAEAQRLLYGNVDLLHAATWLGFGLFGKKVTVEELLADPKGLGVFTAIFSAARIIGCIIDVAINDARLIRPKALTDHM